MENQKRSLQDIIDHPEKATEEELNDIKKIIDHLHDFKKMTHSYVFDMNKLYCTDETYSERFYQEHLVKAAILEAFSFNEDYSLKELNKFIFEYLPKYFVSKLPINLLNAFYGKMLLDDLIRVIDNDDKYNPVFRITKKGRNFLSNQTFQSLAATSFFNYQTFNLTKKMVKISVLMLIVTSLSILVSIITILK